IVYVYQRIRAWRQECVVITHLGAEGRGIRRHQGGDDRGSAVEAVLPDGGEHLLGGGGVRERGAASAMAVQVHQPGQDQALMGPAPPGTDRKSTRLNSSHASSSY